MGRTLVASPARPGQPKWLATFFALPGTKITMSHHTMDTGPRLSRRRLLAQAGAALTAATLSPPAPAQAEGRPAARASGHAPATAPGIVRTLLMQASPLAMPGWELTLRRITLPPGTTNQGEVHPGPQIVHVESGTLRLRVLAGRATLRRGLPGDGVGEAETLGPRVDEYVVQAGDTLHEPEACVHAPRNAGPAPVVLLVAGLMPAGHPPTVFIDPAAVPPR